MKPLPVDIHQLAYDEDYEKLFDLVLQQPFGLAIKVEDTDTARSKLYYMRKRWPRFTHLRFTVVPGQLHYIYILHTLPDEDDFLDMTDQEP